MSEAPASGGGPVRPLTALVFATIGFFALLIFGLGMTSLATGADVIATPGLGQLPGVAAVILATLAFAAGLWAAIRHAATRHPSYWGAAWTTAAAFLAYLAGVWFGALWADAGLAVATAAAGGVATSWFGLVIAAAALVAAWSGIALVRTRARRPRWPWEDEFDE
jgi:hypothetical protein